MSPWARGGIHVPRQLSENIHAVRSRERAARHRRQRVWVEGEDGKPGYWFAQYAPANAHGRATDATYWVCECPPCKLYISRANRKSYERRLYNTQIRKRLEGVP